MSEAPIITPETLKAQEALIDEIKAFAAAVDQWPGDLIRLLNGACRIATADRKYQDARRAAISNTGGSDAGK